MAASVDFAVVGAGIAGASVAYELAEHGSVTLYEMEATAGYHSTGRSAALFTECDGPEIIRRVTAASRRFLADPPPGFVTSPILTTRGVLFVAHGGEEARLNEFFDAQRALADGIWRLSPDEASELCDVLRTGEVGGAVLEPDAKDIDVHTLHQGFLRGFRGRGGSLETSSPVTSLQRVGESWRVGTSNGTADAGIVINAAGAWCDVVGSLAGTRPIGLQPKRRTAFTFAAPPDSRHERWPMVVELDHLFYFRPEGPNLLASPGDQTPVEPQDIRHDELDVALAIDRITRVTTLDITHVQSAWAGLRSFVPDNLPVVGFDEDVEGFFWLAGQGGYGIMTSPAMSRMAAGLITEGTVPSDIAAYGISGAELSPNRLR